MEGNDITSLTELSLDEIDMVGAGRSAISLNLSNLVNINLGINAQVANEFVILSRNVSQSVTQISAIFQHA